MKTCDGCEHLGVGEAVFSNRTAPVYICGHYDLLELDSNDPGPHVRMSLIMPWFCPLTDEQKEHRPEMLFGVEAVKPVQMTLDIE